MCYNQDNRLCNYLGGPIMAKIFIADHPLIAHKLGVMRDKNTTTKEFRDLVSEVSMLLCYEATRQLPLEDIKIETPLESTYVKRIAGKKLCIVPILRAGIHMADGMLELIPNAKVGHIGLYHADENRRPMEFFCKLPSDVPERDTYVVDTTLSTGNSAIAAISLLKKRGVKNITYICILASPQGLDNLGKIHPDVDVYAACKDRTISEKGFILPGFGDAADRIYGTR